MQSVAAAFRKRCASAGIEYDKVVAAHGSPIPFFCAKGLAR